MLIKVNAKQKMPSRGTKEAAGLDLCAMLDVETYRLYPGKRVLMKTGFSIELPEGTFGIVCPRSGLALKHGVTVLNAPGIVDSDYRGDVGVILANMGDEPFDISNGDRIAQLVILRYERVTPVMSVEPFRSSARGEGGFGSTGSK